MMRMLRIGCCQECKSSWIGSGMAVCRHPDFDEWRPIGAAYVILHGIPNWCPLEDAPDIAALEAQWDALIAACEEAASEIEYAHSEMLSQHERNHPRGSGWARVYDRLKAAVAAVRP